MQETNLNVSPYFDDFDVNKDYYKVLFKPGYPIQSRELTTLQSILQNQVEQYGRHIFKEGSVVIPGQLTYQNPIYAVEIESTFNGSPISLYFDNLLDKKIRGSISGVSAQVIYTLKNTESERGNYTLYLKYLESGGANFNNRTFQDSETLILESPLTYGNFTIQSGQGVCNTISTNSISEGSAVSVASGIYFVRGTFARVSPQLILLDQYSIVPSYKIGFNINEDIVSSDQDNSLFDNAQGFSNYAAPGADRLKITLELSKRDIDDLDTNSFVEILRVENGVPQFFNTNTQYNLIRDELARRTFDESGNYFVIPFTLFVRDSLNDRVLNRGIYFKDQKTIQGNTPSEDLMVYEIGPGKAYVNGYDVETISPRLLDIPKTRTTELVENQVIPYNAGVPLVVNNCYGSPSIGLGTNTTVSLMNSRIGTSPHVASGTTIGVARIYDFIPESNYVDDTSNLNLRLFDIQTFTEIGINTSINSNLTTPCLIEGKKSRATGYLKNTVSSGSTSFILYQTSGNFLENEQIIINGIEDGRLINSVIDYSISDIKSIYSQIGISTFNADVDLSKKSYIASPGTVFGINNGVVSVGLNNVFTNIIKVGDIVSYANTSFSGDPIYNRVQSVSLGGTSFTISGITTVSGICNGVLPSGSFTVTNILKINPDVNITNSSLLTKLNSTNISSISLNSTELTQRRSFDNVPISGNSITITIPPSDVDVYFDSFDEDRFVISYPDGSFEPMRSDKYSLDTSTGKTLTFNGINPGSNTTARVIATVKNLKANSKIKKLNKVSSITILNSKFSSSGIGTTTLNDGLTYSQVYGTRVQDKEISLNVPDAVRVLAVYESNGISDPQLPRIEISGNGNGNYVIGERIEGKSSGAVALITGKFDSNKIEYVYLNTLQFNISEVIIGQESKEESIITNKSSGDKNISQNFTFDDGQRETFYDFSRIIRKTNVEDPKRKIKIVFQNFVIDSNDTGEIISANSYSSDDYKNNVSSFNGFRISDFIDIRPRVAPYTGTSKSPFEFDSRNFASDGQYSKYILAPGENLNLSYSYYVGRIDRVFLNSDGIFEVSQGVPSSSPFPPALKTSSLDIATIYIPPFVYDVNNISVDMSQHKRYRMSDISLLENRIQRVEEFTTLSMLESKTENFNIKDAETGLDRFKCGFFVDNFTSHAYHDIGNISFKSCIDTSSNTLRPLHYTTSLDLQLGSEVINGIGQTYSPNKDQSYVSDLGSPNIKKTGDLITLNYNETIYDKQLYATKTESITPFLVRYWEGIITLNPPLDTWVDERSAIKNSYSENVSYVERSDQNITVTNNVTVNREVFVNNPPINQTGVSPFDWINNARNILSNVRTIGGIPVSSNRTDILNGSSGIVRNGNDDIIILRGNQGSLSNTFFRGIGRNPARENAREEEIIRSLVPNDIATQFINQLRSRPSGGGGLVTLTFNPRLATNSITESRQVTTTNQLTSNTSTIIIPPEVITSDTTSESISNYTETVKYLRSRNIEFDVKGLRPRTQFYGFFQAIDISKYIIPKLLEIEMISGKFQIGETVESDPHFTTSKIVFRLCKPNHRTGPFDGSNPPSITNPSPIVDISTGQLLPENPLLLPKLDVYGLNPYSTQPIQNNYTESSTFLNVDTRSLELTSDTDFYGYVSIGMKLIGKSSGAVARVSNLRLVSDNTGRLIGSFFIPDPNIEENPKWINGQNTFTVLDTQSIENLGKTYDEFISNTRINESSASEKFTSNAITNVAETNILTTRNIRVLSGFKVNTTTLTNTTTNTTTVTQTQTSRGGGNVGVRVFGIDPLAQSFFVSEPTGIFLTSVEVYFETKDEVLPVILQIRTMNAGVPSNVTIPFGEVTLSPEEVNLSSDGSVPTKFYFPSPVFLSGPQQQEVRGSASNSQKYVEYSIVLLSQSPQYRVFISELGSNDIQTGVKISAQPTLGSLFKSQNGSTWSPSQLEDLKYQIYRADFVSEGLVRFFNPKLSLGNKKVTVTGSNQFLPLSKRIVVGLGSTGYNTTGVVTGVTIQQGSSSGKLIGVAGSITSISIANTGFGYTNGTFTNVQLENESGYGTGAVATIGVVNSGIATVTITSSGYGYQSGDLLIIPEKEYGLNIGFGGKLLVSSISSIPNSFILDNVQGNFVSGISTLSIVNSSGSVVSTGATVASIFNDQYYDGLHMRISHMNHGMHSTKNYVKISSFRPLISEINSRTSTSISDSTLNIPLVSSSGFDKFEGVVVSAINPGYVIIGNEVIEYNAVNGNTLTATQRGIDSQAQSYDSGVPVYKYEFNGISIRRINKTHNFAQVNNESHPISLHSYFVKIDTSSTSGVGSDRSNDLYFRTTEQSGEPGVVLTNNIQFEAITPNIAYMLPGKTDMGCRVRTVTGTSINGNEDSFVDEGFTSIPLDGTTYFRNPKLICSDVNESVFITETPGNKSFTMEFVMKTTDSRVSPVIDLINVGAILTSNLINSPSGINDDSTYADNDFVRSLDEDKHEAIYISKPVRLTIPANSIKVLLSASHTNNNDIRVLYRIFRDDSSGSSNNYELFPGYNNYQVDGQGIKRVIDASRNDGSSDTKVVFSSDRSFYDYEYSVDDLPDFNMFSIKIVMASNNQAIPPLIKQLRAIATKKPDVR